MNTDAAIEPFERGHVDAVAADFAVEPDRLATLVASHQELVAGSPGVENLVYEWRKQFGASVLARSTDAYYVAAPPWIWSDFADHLETSEEETAALAAVHARALESKLDGESDELGDATPCVLGRS